MLDARTISLSIDRPWQDLYDAIWPPQMFPRWASGLSKSSLEKEGDRWRADGPNGPILLRFTPRNPFGVMDHHVETGDGAQIYVPMRVVPNAGGAEVLITLFRLPPMSEADFLADIEWVDRDLKALRAMVST